MLSSGLSQLGFGDFTFVKERLRYKLGARGLKICRNMFNNIDLSFKNVLDYFTILCLSKIFCVYLFIKLFIS